KPSNTEARFLRATVCCKTQDYKQALEDYLRVYRLNPLKDNILTVIGFCYLLQGELTEASKWVSQAFELKQTLESFLYMNFIQEQLHIKKSPDSMFSMLPKATENTLDIMVFTFPPMGMTGGGQQPQQLTQAFQKMGHRVFYQHQFINYKANNIPGVAVAADLFLMNVDPVSSFFFSQFENRINQFTHSPRSNRIALFTMFSPALNSYIKPLRQAGYKIAYWCLDDWEAMGWPDVPKGTEAEMIRSADYLFAVSKPLVSLLEKHSNGKPVHYIPNGFNRDHFPSIDTLPPEPTDLVKGEELTFVYWGNLTESWLNWDLLTGVAQKHPEWSFNLIGDVKTNNDKTTLPNVHYLGEKPVKRLYRYGRHADIAFIHFKDNRLIHSVSPIKSFEYVACGLPVISSPMPELDGVPNTYQVRSPEEFEAAVETILRQKTREIDETYLAQTTWEHRAQTFLEAIQ
ncbi:MAG: tetratricopeptide repeat-containing glycosyltransferase family protein, partial [Cyanobacteria bacterium]|nr:tetratricopeptide repeat-containing glycosyltransferase family protein [Cyanobacteriota bacterium]